jgi:hypothetical protein
LLKCETKAFLEEKQALPCLGCKNQHLRTYIKVFYFFFK